MRIERRTDWISQEEKLVSLEITSFKQRLYYSYTYFVENGGEFLPLIRWDNFNKAPHIDVYEKAGMKRHNSEEKTYLEVMKLVKMFRQNLPKVDLSKL